MNKYIESQAKAAMPVFSKDLMCKDCKNRDDAMNTAFCKVFQKGKKMKPDRVLLGGNCTEYEPE